MPTVETLAIPAVQPARLSMQLTNSDTALISQLRSALEKRDGKLYTISDIVRESFKSFAKELSTT